MTESSSGEREHGFHALQTAKMGVLYVVGLGAGNRAGMTGEALCALERADVIVGYRTYTELVAAQFPDTEIIASGMRQEIARARTALDCARTGKTVALVCSGDAGVYGMASLCYELCAADSGVIPPSAPVEIVVVAGVTAALSGAALLGAPLANDFAVISLSNLLTPQEVIIRRLRAASQGDFCIALYNPRSNGRPDALRAACAILLETRASSTPCGWVRNVGRAGEEAHTCTLTELSEALLDMCCTAFVGNSTTRICAIGSSLRLITPRGYEH